MRVSLNWLKEYVDVDAPVDDIVRRLTFSGIEVEGVETSGLDYHDVVVGEIRSVERHPNADKLSVCGVFDGVKERRVVCGAPNAAVGEKAPLALAGAVLAGGMKIADRAVRGVQSEGMLCAEDELGLSKDHAGILILDRNAVAGTPFGDIAGKPDTILSLEITWNRPDCLSMIGIAREIAALYGKKLKLPPVDFAEAGGDVSSRVSVTIEDSAGCPRYTGRVFDGVRIGPSPFWMQRRLVAAGMRPISNVVDITNYVMLECGHPLHAFDYELVSDRKIVVRRAKPGEKMATLDGVARNITPDMLLIADGKRPVALAGVMGGAGSEICPQTRSLLLESATFNAAGIRRTSSALGLSTESSYRFERGVDAMTVEWASRRAGSLLVAWSGAKAVAGVVDVFSGKPAERRIICRFARVNSLLGTDVPGYRVREILESLGFVVESGTADGCTVRVPSFRGDVTVEADVIEEIVRMYGLDKVAATEPAARLCTDIDDRPARALIGCRNVLAGLGLSEIVNYTFLSERLLDIFSREDKDIRLVLPNPVSSDYAAMRNSLAPQMVETLGRNMSRQCDTAGLFEIGKVFRRESPGGRIMEWSRVCIGLMGKIGRTGMDRRKPVAQEEMFLWLKGVVAELLTEQKVAGFVFKRASEGWAEDGWAVEVTRDGEKIGILGLLSAGLRREWRMQEPVGVAELDLNPLLANADRHERVRRPPEFPSVKRDVAMVVSSGVTHEDVMAVIHGNAPAELTSCELFDIYEGKGIGEGKRSLAYSLVFRSRERTLTDEEANKLHEGIKNRLRSELKAEIREQ